MLTVERIKEVVTRVGKKYGIKNAYLFGSYARGDADKYSDVDVLIEAGEIRGLFELSGFRLELVDELDGTDVDVITMDGIMPKFFEMIRNERIPLYGC